MSPRLLIRAFKTLYGLFGKKLFILLAIDASSALMQGGAIISLLPLISSTLGEGMTQDDGFPTNILPQSPLGLLILFLVIAALSILVEFIGKLVDAKIRAGLRRQLRLRVFDGFRRVDYQKFSGTSSGDYTNLVGREIPQTLNASQKLTAFITSSVRFAIFLSYAAVANFWVSIVAIGLAIIQYPISHVSAKFRARESRKLAKLHSEMQGLYLEVLRNIQYFLATGSLNHVSPRFEGCMNDISGREFDSQRGVLVNTLIGQIMALLAICAMSGYYLIYNTDALTSLLIACALMQRAGAAMQMIYTNWNGYSALSGSVAAVQRKLEELDSFQRDPGGLDPGSLHSEIRLEGVHFSYGDKPVLKDITLTIKKGDKLAIFGPSGEGKSTLLSIIGGLLQPTVGRILLDGTDYKDLDPEELQKLIGFVTQEPVVFDTGWKANITLWDKVPSKVFGEKEALERVGLGDLSDRKEGKKLGEHGRELSGGQRQRLHVAREIYRDPDVFLLDEPTSALDRMNTDRILQIIRDVGPDKTIIVVSHDPEVSQSCPRQLRVAGGQIVEESRAATDEGCNAE